MTLARWDARSVFTLATVVIYSAWVFSIDLRAGDPGELWWWGLWLPFFLWTIAPFVTAHVIRSDDWFFTLGLIGIAAYSLYVYERDMFGPGARSTSGLIFIFLPIDQWIALALLVGGAWAFRRLTK